MYVKRAADIGYRVIEGGGAQGVAKRVLVSPEQGWAGWVMRLFTLGPGGHTPDHSHPWPHIVFVHEGDGTLTVDGDDHPVTAGFVAVVPGGARHQFRNAGSGDFTFVCIVPEEGDV